MLTALRMKLRAELEAPGEARRFGSGWIAGTLGLLAAVTGLLMVVALRHPSLLTVPELAVVRASSWFQPAVYAVVSAGYLLSALSLALRPEKILGVTAMTVTLAATLLGATRGEAAADPAGSGLFLGLDFFVLNVLFMGFLFVPLEKLLALRPEQPLFREEWREDLFYYLVSSLFVQVLTFLTLVPSHLVLAAGDWAAVRAAVGALPWLLQVALIMLLTDFAQYWVHRAFHRVPFLWRFHAVHHSARSMDWLASARMHVLEIVALRSLTALPMFVLGFQESALQAYLLIVYIYSAFIHANIRGRFGVLEEVLVVPRFHHWHHGVEREAIDVNFAIHFPFLDRLFGTHHMPGDRWPEGYGIADHPVPKGYWAQFLYPFRKG